MKLIENPTGKIKKKVKVKHKPDKEIFDDDELRLGSTTQSSLRQAKVKSNNVTRAPRPGCLKLEPTTTRSSPRLVSGSAAQNDDTPTRASSGCPWSYSSHALNFSSSPTVNLEAAFFPNTTGISVAPTFTL